MKDIFTLRNFSRSLILGLIGLIFYYLIRMSFKRENEDWMFYVLMFFIFFFINFVLGNGNRTWKDFLTLKKRND
jgi:drug/metabolite transporter (DMT)-like permease